MRSFEDILYFSALGASLPDAVLDAESKEQMQTPQAVEAAMRTRLEVMRQTVREALKGDWHPQLIRDDKDRYHSGAVKKPLSGDLIWRASEIAVALGTCNASMGRIVAAPTAGSCGILPGLLFAWQEVRGGSDKALLEGLLVAAAVGDIIAHRATLAGASGGCQAECGSACAMGAAALCHMEGGSPEACSHAAALALKSILGLACDPVAGLVESPCVKRNGSLVAVGAVAADMALAGIRSIIPPDEVVDAMADVGRSLPPTLRETGRGGCAVTPTGRKLTKALKERHGR